MGEPGGRPPPGCAPEEEDAAAVARARADPAAFAPLYDRYVDPVYRYCYRNLGSREAAEDATAQVFAAALAALPAYRGGGAFRSWLFAIARNAVVDAHRQRRPDVPLADAEARPAGGQARKSGPSPGRTTRRCAPWSPACRRRSSSTWRCDRRLAAVRLGQ